MLNGNEYFSDLVMKASLRGGHAAGLPVGSRFSYLREQQRLPGVLGIGIVLLPVAVAPLRCTSEPGQVLLLCVVVPRLQQRGPRGWGLGYGWALLFSCTVCNFHAWAGAPDGLVHWDLAAGKLRLV